MTLFKTIEFKIKALFFQLFRLLLEEGDKGRIPLDGRKIIKVLFLRPDRIGDTVCSFPLMDHLQKSFPQMRFAIFASTKNYGLVKEDPRFEKIYIYRRNLWHDIREVKSARRENYDLLVDLMGDDSVTTLFLSQLSVRKKPRIGVNKKRFGIYYDYTYVQGADCTEHTIDINLHLVEAFGHRVSDVNPFAPPFLDLESVRVAGEFFERLKEFGKSGPRIGFNLSARGDNRDWGLPKAEDFLKRAVEVYPDAVFILITMPAERHKGDRLQKALNDRVVQIFPEATLPEVSAVIKGLDMLISPDTSLVHIARSFRIPVIGLYPEFKNIYRQWLPYRFERGLVLSRGDDNIFNIEVNEVWARFQEIWPELASMPRRENKI